MCAAWVRRIRGCCLSCLFWNLFGCSKSCKGRRDITWVNRIRCYISRSLLFTSQRDVIKFKALFSATLFHFHKYSNGIEALLATAIKTKTWFSSRGFIFSVLLHRMRQWCRLNLLHFKFYDNLEALKQSSLEGMLTRNRKWYFVSVEESSRELSLTHKLGCKSFKNN